jgi:ATP-binding cassette subfamily B protein
MYLTVGLMPLVTLIMNLSVIALFWFGGNMAISGTLSNGNLMAFLSYLTQVLSSLMMVTMMTINFTRAKACADRINEVFDTQTTIGEPDAPKTPQGYDVVFDHVSFQYNAADPESVLKDISFDAKPGQTIGIIGGTGSGKSTLVSLIPRLYDATQGQVRIGGVDVRQIGLEQLRAMVGVVLQESLLFSGTVGENLRWGNPQAPDEVLYQALSDAQGLEFIQNRQDGLRRKWSSAPRIFPAARSSGCPLPAPLSNSRKF